MDPTEPGSDFPEIQHPAGGMSVPWTPADSARDTVPGGITACVPFVVQSGRMILMVEASDDGWTLAELDFLPEACVFRESRRVTYTWPREAFGAMLSRLAGADVDSATFERLTADFAEWLAAGFSQRRGTSPARC
jgi:hypothetical protein